MVELALQLLLLAQATVAPQPTAGEHVSLTRSELGALIDEAVRKDRTRR